MFNWMRRATSRPAPPPMPTEELPAASMERYAQEFMAAWDMTERIGLKVAPLQLLVAKDCINMDQIAPVIQKVLGPYQENEVPTQTFAINALLADQLSRQIVAPLYLTMGWTEVEGC